MGDRSNIQIKNYDGSSIYLYAHWSGESIIESAIAGLESDRVDDPPYLARIIFQHMIRDEELGEETGYGISATLTDNEHPILTIEDGEVYFEKQTEPVPAKKFVELVESVEGWARLANAGGLYEVLIERLKGEL